MGDVVAITPKIAGLQFEIMTKPPQDPFPDGPFTVTISNADGAMFEVTFRDASGVHNEGDGVLATQDCFPLLANLLTGALRVFLGAS